MHLNKLTLLCLGAPKKISVPALEEWVRRLVTAHEIPETPDIHTVTACRTFSKAYYEVTEEERRQAKRLNYIYLYGG